MSHNANFTQPKRKTTKPGVGFATFNTVKCYFVLALICASYEVAFGSWGSVHVGVRFPVAESAFKKNPVTKRPTGVLLLTTQHMTGFSV